MLAHECADSLSPVAAGVQHPKRSYRAVWLPAIGLLFAVALIISRRPGAITHAGFWAEDGQIYFADVYNLGIRHTLHLPQAGYFETFPVLAAWVARFFTLPDAPTVTSVLALLVQALPAALLLSPRARPISSDVRVRALLAFVLVAIPNDLELDATAVNAQWSLVIAALIVLVMDPPHRRRWRAIDAGVLLITGLTGPFAFILAPMAWLRRRLGRGPTVPAWMIGMLLACAAVQVVSVVIVSHHVSGPGIEARPHPQLGATAGLLARMLGGRVVLGTIIGEGNGMTASGVLQWIALGVGAVAVLALLRRGRQELQMFVILAIFTLAGALLDPSAPSPAWPALAATPPGSQRYFLLAELAVVAILIAAALSSLPVVVRAVSAGLAAVAIAVAVLGHWSLPSLPRTDFSREASVFDRARPGTVVTFGLNPVPWSMTLVKR